MRNNFAVSLGNIKDVEWKDLLLGLQEKFNLEQGQLLDKAGLKRDFHVSEWINGNRIPTDNKKEKFLELINKSDFQPNDLIYFGRKIRQSILFRGKWISVSNAKSFEDTDKNLLINKGGKNYLNVLRLFPFKKDNKTIKFIEEKNNALIYYNEKRSTRPTPLFLPKLLEIDKDFLIGLGIYLGEGSRNRHPKVTNSEPKIIDQAIKFFDLFGIERNRLKVWIQLHERADSSFEEVKSYWLNNTYLKPENIIKIRIKKSSGRAPVKKFGVVHLEVNSILLQLLVDGLINSIPLILEGLSSKEKTLFLKGAFAAEGSVGLAKSGSVNEINYTSTRKDERGMIKDLLEEFNIVVHDNDKRFSLRVFGFENLSKLVNLQIFEYHPERNKKLCNGFDKLKSSLELF